MLLFIGRCIYVCTKQHMKCGRSLARTELYSAGEVFFTGTAIGIKPIVQIDRRMISNGSKGSITQQIRLSYTNQIYRIFSTGVLNFYISEKGQRN